jgi:hypothetical protein
MGKKLLIVAGIIMAVMFIGALSIGFSMLMNQQGVNNKYVSELNTGRAVTEYNKQTMSCDKLKDLVNSQSMGIDKPIVVIDYNHTNFAYGGYASTTTGTGIASSDIMLNWDTTYTSLKTWTSSKVASTIYVSDTYIPISEDWLSDDIGRRTYQVSTLYNSKKIPIGIVAYFTT